jgi:hypothetical protein
MIPRGYPAGIKGKKNTNCFGGCFEKWDTSQSAFTGVDQVIRNRNRPPPVIKESVQIYNRSSQNFEEKVK